MVAPGDLILSTCGSEQYCIGSGTNLAAAHVEGVASLVWSVNPELSPAQVRTILQESATDLGAEGYDEEYGYGKVDAAKAVAMTPHHLWLQTPNQDRRSLVFLLDDTVTHTCQTVWNLGTTSQTWYLKSDAAWLTVEGPGDAPASAPVPSDSRVCVDAGTWLQAGTYQTTLEAISTLAHHGEPVRIDVTAIYQPHLSRVRLGLVQRP